LAHYKVILAYDGTEFRGFQRQAGARTVQDVLERALRELGWQGRAILAAGRTDTGVHASGQVIAFELDWRHSPDNLQDALNANLPADVAAIHVQPALAAFHPRYDALARRYRYRIYCQAARNPLLERYAWRVWPAPDAELVEAAASQLVGRHDFAAFGAPPRAGGSTVRTVFEAGWQTEGEGWAFEIVADAFLYHMVRRIVYLLAVIGQARLPAKTMLEVLESGRAEGVQGLAPAQGLALVEVVYTPKACQFELSGDDERG
jgi:tRNA pseudouridine38-40 synthase